MLVVMYFFILVVALVSAVECTDKKDEAFRCGTPKINGDTNAKGVWPWQVLIRQKGVKHCSGVLVSPFWVLTAGHCVLKKRYRMYEFDVVVGEYDLDKKEGTETSIGVSRITIHKGYSSTTLDNDVALLKLFRPAPFGKYIGTVCLPKEDEAVPIGTECTVTGWGQNERSGLMHRKLHQGKLKIVKNSKCNNLNTQVTGTDITEHMLCASYGPSQTTSSGCYGNSGSPLVCKDSSSNQWYLHGVVSWGSSCDTKDAYTVFSKISNLRNWIVNNAI